MNSLERFVQAQSDSHAGFESAMSELRAGRKTSHWIWYVFPQLAGLGHSSMARTYALGSVDEAIAYLSDPVLGARYREAAKLVGDQLARGIPLRTLMGSEIDALKLVSSLTLFEAAAQSLPDRALVTMIESILIATGREGFSRCRFTSDRVSP